MAAPRKYLGRDQNMAGMIRVYLLQDSLEVDEMTFVEIERTRVYFDDVLSVTYHRAISWSFSILMGLIGGILGAVGVVLLVQKEWAGAVTMLILASPSLICVAAHLILKTDFITVFGRRTLARMRFRVRKGRAREVFSELTTKIRAAQAAAAAAQPAPPPPESPELPPGPPVGANPN